MNFARVDCANFKQEKDYFTGLKRFCNIYPFDLIEKIFLGIGMKPEDYEESYFGKI